MTSILAHNIKVLSSSDHDGDLKMLPNSIPRIYFVNFGNENGIMVWNDFVLGGKQNYYMKKLIEKINVGALNNKIIF